MEFTGCHEPVELRCHAGQLLLPTPAVQWLQQFTSARTHGNASPRCPTGGLGGSARPASGSVSPHPIVVGLGRLPTGRTCVLAWTPKPGSLSRAPLTPLPPLCQNYQLHSGEVNGGLPSVSGFSSASTPYGVSSHTPPISGTDSMMGTYCPRARGDLQHDPSCSTAMQRLNWKIKVLCKPLALEAVIYVSVYPDAFYPLCATWAWS